MTAAPWWETPEGRAEARAEMLAAGMQRCEKCDGPEEPPAPPEDPDSTSSTSTTSTPPLNCRIEDYTGGP